MLDFAIMLLIAVTLYHSLKLITALENSSLSGDYTTLEFLSSEIKQILFEKPYGIFRFVTPLILLYAFLAVIGVFDTVDLQLLLWAGLTILASLIMKGYNSNSPVSIQRATVTAPVLVSLAGVRLFSFPYIYFKEKVIRRLVSFVFCAYIVFVVSYNALYPIYPPNIYPEPSKIQTRVVLNSQKMLGLPYYNKEAPPVLLYFTEEGKPANPYDLMKYINPDMLTLTSDAGVITEQYSLENGAMIYARETAAVPAEIVSMGEFEALNWVINGKGIVIRRLLIAPAG